MLVTADIMRLQIDYIGHIWLIKRRLTSPLNSGRKWDDGKIALEESNMLSIYCFIAMPNSKFTTLNEQ